MLACCWVKMYIFLSFPGWIHFWTSASILCLFLKAELWVSATREHLYLSRNHIYNLYQLATVICILHDIQPSCFLSSSFLPTHQPQLDQVLKFSNMYSTALISLLPLASFTYALPQNAVSYTPDACGSAIQNQPGSPTDSCNTPIAASNGSPQIYGAYLDDNPSYSYGPPPSVPLGWTSNCSQSITDLCNQLSGNTDALKNTWTWNSDGTNCQVGMWIPDPSTGAAKFPTSTMCDELVLTPLVSAVAAQASADSKTNRGSVNIAIGNFPTSKTQTGGQLDSGYPGWIVQG